MRAISVHVAEDEYGELKALATRRRQPVAQLIREAMSAYLEAERRTGSILQLAPHDSGELLRPWQRHEIYDEMRER